MYALRHTASTYASGFLPAARHMHQANRMTAAMAAKIISRGMWTVCAGDFLVANLNVVHLANDLVSVSRVMHDCDLFLVEVVNRRNAGFGFTVPR